MTVGPGRVTVAVGPRDTLVAVAVAVERTVFVAVVVAVSVVVDLAVSVVRAPGTVIVPVDVGPTSKVVAVRVDCTVTDGATCPRACP